MGLLAAIRLLAVKLLLTVVATDLDSEGNATLGDGVVLGVGAALGTLVRLLAAVWPSAIL